MKITDFLDAGAIIADLAGRDKNAVLKEMTEWIAAKHPSLDAQEVFRVLLEREKISSTAIGEGVAIPHAKLAGVEQIYAMFARSTQGVNFDSLDGGLTYLFFVLIAPENSTGDHLKALARIARLLKNPAFRARLLKGKSPQELFAIIREEDARF